MADKGGRGSSGIGLFIMGLLIGVVGTLVTQKIVTGGGGHSNTLPEATTITPAPESADSDAKPKLVVHSGGLSSAKPKSAAAAAVDQSPADVADDAAAAGMTSRTPRQTPPQN